MAERPLTLRHTARGASSRLRSARRRDTRGASWARTAGRAAGSEPWCAGIRRRVACSPPVRTNRPPHRRPTARTDDGGTDSDDHPCPDHYHQRPDQHDQHQWRGSGCRRLGTGGGAGGVPVLRRLALHLPRAQGEPHQGALLPPGGGACFDAKGCGPASTDFTRNLSDPRAVEPETAGIFDLGNRSNPFADYSMVMVPYYPVTSTWATPPPTTATGWRSTTSAASTPRPRSKRSSERSPARSNWSSPGRAPARSLRRSTPRLAADRLPTAKVTVLADGSGGYPDIPGINALIGSQWGTMKAVPSWPETAGLTAEQWSFPGLFVVAGRRHPGDHLRPPGLRVRQDPGLLREARRHPGRPPGRADRQERGADRVGRDPVLSFIASGRNHTVLGSARFYTHEVNGTRFVDWVTRLVGGERVTDVHCTDCTG